MQGLSFLSIVGFSDHVLTRSVAPGAVGGRVTELQLPTSDTCSRLLSCQRMAHALTIDGAKATESVRTAESEFVNGRYTSCTNRCDDACVQAAIAARLREGGFARAGRGATRLSRCRSSGC